MSDSQAILAIEKQIRQLHTNTQKTQSSHKNNKLVLQTNFIYFFDIFDISLQNIHPESMS